MTTVTVVIPAITEHTFSSQDRNIITGSVIFFFFKKVRRTVKSVNVQIVSSKNYFYLIS